MRREYTWKQCNFLLIVKRVLYCDKICLDETYIYWEITNVCFSLAKFSLFPFLFVSPCIARKIRLRLLSGHCISWIRSISKSSVGKNWKGLANLMPFFYREVQPKLIHFWSNLQFVFPASVLKWISIGSLGDMFGGGSVFCVFPPNYLHLRDYGYSFSICCNCVIFP